MQAAPLQSTCAAAGCAAGCAPVPLSSVSLLQEGSVWKHKSNPNISAVVERVITKAPEKAISIFIWFKVTNWATYNQHSSTTFTVSADSFLAEYNLHRAAH